MRTKICSKCGKEFNIERKSSDKHLCPECSSKAKKESVYKERVCTLCGTTFWGFPNSKYCPNCSQEVRKAKDKEYRNTPTRRPLGSIDHCLNCGNEYIVKSGMQKYCPDCSEQMKAEKERARKREYMKQNQKKYNELKMEHRGKRYVCKICGKVFEKHSSTVTCSPECQKELLRITRNKVDLKRGKRKIAPEQRRASNLPKSGIPGVTWRKNGKWQATYKKHYIGVFDNIEEAKNAIDQYKNTLIGFSQKNI